MASTDQDIRNRLLLARLPAMPQILLKLIDLCQTDEAGMAELAELVGNDAAMVGKVMGIANSAAYHRGDRSPDLLQALNTLGSDMLKTLVISESVFQTLNGFPHSRSVDLRAFWKHALTAAVMARDIARHAGYAHPEEAYLCGLLHDVGRLALLAAAPNEYSGNFNARDDEALCEVEQRSLQITHAEAGAWLIERWNLDSFMADSVLYHHETAVRISIAHPLIRIVHLSSQLANLGEDEALPDDAGAFCGLDASVLAAVRQLAESQVAREAELLGIDLSGAQEQTQPASYSPPLPADPTQQQLEEEVRNVALTAELGQALARQKAEPQLLDMARQSARILFNLDDSIILCLDDSGTSLQAASVGPRRQRFSDFALPLAGGGRLAEAALQRRPSVIGPDRTALGMAEDQMLRTFGTECLLCVPLTFGSRCMGVMVSGIAQGRVAELQARERFLQAFGTKVAGALENLRRDRGEQELSLAGLRDDYALHSRKVAHEVNNPLGIIRNYLEVIDDKVARQEPVAGELAVVHEEIARVGNLVREFADEAPARPGQERTDINRVAHHLVQLFRGSRFLPANVQIELRTPELPSEISGPADTVKQILLNLMKNAIEALPRGGLIEIHNQGRVYQDGRVFHHLSVRDDGPGLPAQVLERLFTPVRSSKGGSHRGLGLSIVHDLVRKLGGTIGCASSSSGTTFDILLPAYVPQTGGERVPLRENG